MRRAIALTPAADGPSENSNARRKRRESRPKDGTGPQTSAAPVMKRRPPSQPYIALVVALVGMCGAVRASCPAKPWPQPPLPDGQR